MGYYNINGTCEFGYYNRIWYMSTYRFMWLLENIDMGIELDPKIE